MNKRRLSILLILLLQLATVLPARVVGRRSDLDEILKQLEVPLHQKKVDVVGGNTAAYKLGSRPRVAPLAGMPTKAARADWSSRPWMKDFRSGVAGVVAAVKSTKGRRTSNQDAFLKAWERAPRDKRVFISFTAKDVATAEAVADALTAKGYVAFVYLKSTSGGPVYDAKLAGRLFAEAGHHYAVDTPNARKSAGVWLETSMARRFGGPEGRSPGGIGGSPTPPPPKPKPRPAAPAESWSGRDTFLRGIHGWVVTENPETPGKLFVHRRSNGFMLQDLLYKIQVRSNGAWVVYDSDGSRLGTISKPPDDVHIGGCGCAW